MSKPPELFQIRPEDFDPKDRRVGAVISQLLNNFLLQIIQLLNQSLTFTDNFSAEIKTLSIKGGEEVTFKLHQVKTPVGVTLQNFRNTSSTAEVLTIPVSVPQWAYDGKGNVTIQAVPGLTNGDFYNLTFLIISG